MNTIIQHGYSAWSKLSLLFCIQVCSAAFCASEYSSKVSSGSMNILWYMFTVSTQQCINCPFIWKSNGSQPCFWFTILCINEHLLRVCCISRGFLMFRILQNVFSFTYLSSFFIICHFVFFLLIPFGHLILMLSLCCMSMVLVLSLEINVSYMFQSVCFHVFYCIALSND